MSDDTLKRQDEGGMSDLPPVFSADYNGGYGLVPCVRHPDTPAVDCVICEPVDYEEKE